MLKRLGWKHCCNKYKVITSSFYKWSRVLGSTTLEYNDLKKKHTQIIAFLTFIGKQFRMTNGSGCCIKV